LDRDVIIGQKPWRLGLRGQLPSFEPKAGAGRIDARGAPQVLAKIQKDVDKSVADFARGAESSSMIAVGEDLALADECSVDRVRETNGDSCHPTGKSDPIVGFYDQMNVIGLCGEMHDAKPIAPRFDESAAKRREDQLLAKARQSA
jgi:hypothetical protein